MWHIYYILKGTTMKTNFFKTYIIILFMCVHFSLITLAENNVDFDSQRPADMSDTMWSSLRNAVQTEKLLPTPVGVGGRNCRSVCPWGKLPPQTPATELRPPHQRPLLCWSRSDMESTGRVGGPVARI